MVIVELKGGLGNQMFQYACGKVFALKHNSPLLIDDSFLKQNQLETGEFTPRSYELGIFNLKTEIASESLVEAFNKNSIPKKIKKKLGLGHNKCYAEVTAKDASQLNNITPPVLLKGYWQSEQYFIDHKNEIRDAFKFNAISVAGLDELLQQINRPNSVSIHFRRGDYLTNPVALKVLGPLDINYYNAAIKKLQNEIKDPFFYIFSDEPEWVKKNFAIDGDYRIVDDFGAHHNHYHMMLMSKCRHHIIANSSYSWWGAWLNPDPQKIVIAPKRWFASEDLNANTTNLVPAGWIRI